MKLKNSSNKQSKSAQNTLISNVNDVTASPVLSSDVLASSNIAAQTAYSTTLTDSKQASKNSELFTQETFDIATPSVKKSASKSTKNSKSSNNVSKSSAKSKSSSDNSKSEQNSSSSNSEAVKTEAPKKKISLGSKKATLKIENTKKELESLPEAKKVDSDNTKMKILFAASEAAPFVKTGGLGDVVGSLPKAIAKKGDCDVRVVIPLYSAIDEKWRSQMKFIGHTNVNLAWRNLYCGVFSLDYEGVTYYFIDNEYYFKRIGIYGSFDDAERYAFFSKAVLDILYMLDYRPDIIHCNDWQTALTPVYLRLLYKNDYTMNKIKTVFTIHNLQYQGRFTGAILGDVFGLGSQYYERDVLEFYKDVNLMKGAIMLSDKVTTVSPTYANEVQYKYYAYGLEGVLSANSHKLVGILNKIDTEMYDPNSDNFIFSKYSAKNPEGKRENKSALLKLLGLNEASDDVPVIGIVSRLVEHKGLDLICSSIDELMKEDIRLIVVGTGEWRYEQMLKDAMHRYPGKMSVNIVFSTDLASKVYAGSDIILMPSKNEPCGLTQMIAMRYGAIPVVRETGGLRDTVRPYNEFTGEGNGFSFANYTSNDMLHVVRQAIGYFRNKPVWNKLVSRNLSDDYSWNTSADEYENLYKDLCK